MFLHFWNLIGAPLSLELHLLFALPIHTIRLEISACVYFTKNVLSFIKRVYVCLYMYVLGTYMPYTYTYNIFRVNKFKNFFVFFFFLSCCSKICETTLSETFWYVEMMINSFLCVLSFHSSVMRVKDVNNVPSIIFLIHYIHRLRNTFSTKLVF